MLAPDGGQGKLGGVEGAPGRSTADPERGLRHRMRRPLSRCCWRSGHGPGARCAAALAFFLAVVTAGVGAAPGAVAAPEWRDAGVLADGRSNHTSTLLPNGRVLVAGGRTSIFATTSSAEVYDPAFVARVGDLSAKPLSARTIQLRLTSPNPWSATAGMAAPRSGHSATRISDGRVLVAGGFGSNGKALASVELYDPATGRWFPAAGMGLARGSHTATPLGSGRVLVSGGIGSDGAPTASAEIFDPVAGTWTPTPPMSTARFDHTATLLGGGTVLAVGGYNQLPPAPPMRSEESYDPATGAWSATACPDQQPPADQPSACLHIPRASHTATLLPGGRLLVAGGIDDGNLPRRSAELYDPSGQSWTVTPPMAAPHADHTAEALPDGRVLVVGGRGGPDDPATPRREDFFATAFAQLYDPAAGTWSATDQLGAPRHEQASTLLAGPGCESQCGTILIIGGLGAGGTFLPLAERFGLDAAPGDHASARQSGYVIKQSRSPITDLSSFERSRSLCGGVCPLTGSPGSGLSLTVTGLRPRTSYHYAVRAKGEHGQLGALSNPASVKTLRDRRRPGRVTKVRTRSLSARRLRLSFSAPGDDGAQPPPATRYVIKQSKRPIRSARRFRRARVLCRRCRFSPKRVGARIKVTVTGLRPRRTYYYAVRAKDDAGNLGPRSKSVRGRPGRTHRARRRR